MTNTKIKPLILLGGLIIAFFALAALFSTTEGIVVDDHGKPVKGAYVIVYWTANVGIAVQPHTRCYHSETTITDENGRFHASRLLANLDPLKTDRKRYVEAFMPGYQFVATGNFGVLMAPFKGTKSEQFKKLATLYDRRRCEDDKGQLLFIKAIRAELIKLAESQEEKKQIDSQLSAVEKVEFGYEVATERAIQRDVKARKDTPRVEVGIQSTVHQIILPSSGLNSQCILSNIGGQPELKCQPAKVIPLDGTTSKGNK